MKTINDEQLNTILESHKHWLNKDCDNWEYMKANLSGSDLRGVDLRDSNLSGADLSYADIRCANIYCASLYGANLNSADLRCANLYGADMHDANLNNVKIRDANLNSAEISGAHNISYISMICPEEGAFIGWKKARIEYKSVIIKLSIPASAKRSSATSRKCRCNKAKVLEIYNLDGTVAEERKCYSYYDNDFIYEVGKMVKVNDFDDDRWNECSHGIHFFINRQEAINYMSR